MEQKLKFDIADIKEINFIPDLERTKETIYIDTVSNPDVDVLFPPERFMEMQEDIIWDL